MRGIDAHDRTVGELLKDRKYGIDEYQREYKWGSKHIEELLDDFHAKFSTNYDPRHDREEVAEYDSYFLGSIVLSRRGSKNYIVDGQQRLISLTLLLICLHHLQRELDVPNRTNVEDLISSIKFGKRSFNLGLDIRERVACLDALFNARTYEPTDTDESVQNMVAAYDYIREQFPESLQDKDTLPFFVDWLIEKVVLVEIGAESEDDAYTIFETMNDRGRPLTPTDMLKGYLLSCIADPSERVHANQLWKDHMLQLAKLGREEGADFIKHWLRAKYAQSIRERKKDAEKLDFDRIGTAFHKWVRDNKDTIGLEKSGDFKNFVERLFVNYAQVYARMREAAESFDNDLDVVFYNGHNNFTLQYPVLLAPIAPGDDGATVDRKIRLVATYLDILIARRAVNYLTLTYSSMSYTMFNLMKDIRDLAVPDLLGVLKQKVAEMEWGFSGTTDGSRHGVPEFRLNQWSKRYIHHILARITAHIETQCGMPNRFSEYVSREVEKPFEIEHIWADKFERHRDEFTEAEQFARSRNKIGGLVLVPRGFNQSYGDLPYGGKRKHYLGQNLLAQSLHDQCYDHNPAFRQYIERSGLPFQPHAEFKSGDLEARQELYRQICEEIWSPDRLDRDAADQ